MVFERHALPVMAVSDNAIELTQHGDLQMVQRARGRVALNRAGQAAAEWVESFNVGLRDERFNETIFTSLAHAQLAA